MPARDLRYRVVVIELDDILPRLEVGLPNLLVATTVPAPEERLLRLNSASGSPEWAAGHGVAVRDDLALRKTFVDRERANKACRWLQDQLVRRGYVVNRRQQHRLYVIELDGSHLAKRGRGFLYVGETTMMREARYRQHRQGAVSGKGQRLSANAVHQHWVGARPDLTPTRYFVNRDEAELAEASLRRRLEDQGYSVRGGHRVHDRSAAGDPS